MEINFNPSQAPKPGDSPKVSRRQAAGASSGDAASGNVDSVEQRLQDIPLVRPEKMDSVRDKISDVKYPPEALLNGIAHLLALHIK